MKWLKEKLAQAQTWITLVADRITCPQAAYLGLLLCYGAPALGLDKALAEKVALAFYLMLASRH